MLSVNHVYFSYHNQPVFSDLNLEIAEGEFAFLIGKSGVGKTSLTRMIYMDLLFIVHRTIILLTMEQSSL